MQIYLVGGSVRDNLLNLPNVDNDYVVVNSSVEEMLNLGFKLVGKDFPVFLHPETHEEYALARTERKISKGYKGFKVYSNKTISLEQDLSRRDLTINAMATPLNWDKKDTSLIIDPFNGLNDLKNKTLRHVSLAFKEDPVRILRIARFSARFPDFKLAFETFSLIKEMVNNGEINSLASERIWQEISLGILSKKPSKIFHVLNSCGALKVLIPNLNYRQINFDILDNSPSLLNIRLAILFFNLNSLKELNLSWKIPKDCKELINLVFKIKSQLLNQINQFEFRKVLDFFQLTDAFRKPKRFEDLLIIFELFNQLKIERTVLLNLLNNLNDLDIKSIIKNENEGEKIKELIYSARLEKLIELTKN